MAFIFLVGILFPRAKQEKIPDFCKQMVQGQGQIRCDGQGMLPGALVLLDGKKLNLNKASELDLLRIPHLSQKVARAIVARRKELGRFTSIEEVDAVKGVGLKTRDRLLQLTTLDP